MLASDASLTESISDILIECGASAFLLYFGDAQAAPIHLACSVDSGLPSFIAAQRFHCIKRRLHVAAIPFELACELDAEQVILYRDR
jgi:hypothetical protein